MRAGTGLALSRHPPEYLLNDHPQSATLFLVELVSTVIAVKLSLASQ